jgi:hypothetical protein
VKSAIVFSLMVDGSGSRGCRIFCRLRPVRMVRKRGAMCLTAAGRRGILINSGTTVDRFTLSNSRIENVASAYMTTGIDITLNATYSSAAPNNVVNNVATATAISGSALALKTSAPTVSAGSGTFTSASAALRYQTSGKQTFFNVVVNITTNGTAAGNVIVSGLPFTFGGNCTAAGRAIAISGKMLQSLGQGGTSLSIWNYDNTYPGANGEQLVVNGVCEST